MRAFLAVAVLAASCTARSHKRTGWEPLKRRMLEGAVPTSDDVEFMLDTIEDEPAARGEVLQVMMSYIQGKKDTKGYLPKLSTADDPLISRVFEVETFESLLDMAVSERNRCKRAKACDDVFLRFAIELVRLIVVTAKRDSDPDLDPLIRSRADDIISLSQHAADRARGTEHHEVMSMRADLLRSILTGNFEGLQDHIRAAPRVIAHAERARARDDDWMRLLMRLNDGYVMSTNDVDLIFERLEDSPENRGFIAAGMRSYYVGALQNDPTGLVLIEDPLFTRLVEPATFKRLLQMASFEHKKCARADTLYELNCEQFRVELASLFGLLVVRAGDHEYGDGEANLAFRELRRSGFEALVNSHTKDILALMDRAAEFASSTSQFDKSKILHTVEVTRTLLDGSQTDTERIEYIELSALEEMEKQLSADSYFPFASAGKDDTEDKGRRSGLAEESESGASRKLAGGRKLEIIAEHGRPEDAEFIRDELLIHRLCNKGGGNLGTMKGLLDLYRDANWDPNRRDEYGQTALFFCAKRAGPKFVQLLVDYDYDVNHFIEGDRDPTVLFLAENASVVEVLLAAGADPNLTNFEGATALHGAAERDNPEIIKKLIEHGADVNAQQTGGALAGFTALAMAVVMKHKRAIKELLKHGADWDVEVFARGMSVAELYAAANRMSQDDWMRFIGKLFIESGLTLDQLDHLNLSHPRGVNPKYEKPAPLFETKIDIYPFRLAAVLLVAVVAIRVWKRRASAHERAARELLDDLAPSARTRGGRVADAKVASVPVWATLLRVAVCCAALLYSVIVLIMDQNKKGTALMFMVQVFLSWNGIWTVFERFAPEGSIGGRVGADALMILRIIFGTKAYWYQTLLLSLNLLGTGRLAYDCVGWLRRFVQKSGPGAGRAPKADERPSTGARASQQRGARPGLRKRANRSRRREATPRSPEPDPPETESETAASEPKAPEPEPEPEPTRATDVRETVPEPTAPEPKVPEPEPEPAPVAEPRALTTAPVPESKVEEPVALAPVALEAKLEEPLLATQEPAAAPEGFEIVARVLEHLNEPHLLPIFVAEEINDNVLPCLDPSDLIGLGVSQMTCLTILGAAHSAAKNKKLETEDVLDNVAKHQSVLEEALREHREEIKRLRIRELPEDLCCPITCEIMKDPVLCVEDGHTYERVAVEQWFATGARTSPATSAELESTALAPNHMARKLIAALLEEHGGERRRDD